LDSHLWDGNRGRSCFGIPHPLKALLRRWSRDLAAAQTVAVVEAGGRTVSLGDLLGAEFETSPAVLFSKDQFHPSPAGYARVAAVLLPTVCAALGLLTLGDTQDRPPVLGRGESITPLAVAAGAAARRPGTEVSGTDVAGTARGPRGRWALRLRRHGAVAPHAAGGGEADADGLVARGDRADVEREAAADAVRGAQADAARVAD